MTREISNSEDIIDSREIIARIDELESDIAAAEITVENGAEENADGPNGEHVPRMATCGECGKTWDDGLISATTPAPSARCPYEDIHDAIEELRVLKSLASEGEDSPDWNHGETLIRDSYFRDYAEQLAEDIGSMNSGVRNEWPFTHIDWDAAADALKSDYFSVDFDGVEYWIRS